MEATVYDEETGQNFIKWYINQYQSLNASRDEKEKNRYAYAIRRKLQGKLMTPEPFSSIALYAPGKWPTTMPIITDVQPRSIFLEKVPLDKLDIEGRKRIFDRITHNVTHLDKPHVLPRKIDRNTVLGGILYKMRRFNRHPISKFHRN